jgi:hypothetical protein
MPLGSTKQRGCTAKHDWSSAVWITFNDRSSADTLSIDWVPKDLKLNREEKIKWRLRISEPPSESDSPGYLYAFDIGLSLPFWRFLPPHSVPDKTDKLFCRIKIGKSTSPNRTNAWRMCHPRLELYENLPTRWCGKLESLIHSELQGHRIQYSCRVCESTESLNRKFV